MILGRRERAFALEALFFRARDLGRLRRLGSSRLDWVALFRAGKANGLAPLIRDAVEEASLWGEVPLTIREALETEYLQNTAQNAALLTLLARAQETLGRAGIEALPIKGAAMLVLEPRLVELRHVSDIDLLVRPADADRAAAEMATCGWHQAQASVDVRGTPVAQARGLGRVTHGAVFIGATGLCLELHHALPGMPGRPLEATDAFFGRARPHPLGRGKVRCPSAEDMVAVACSHAMHHHREESIHLPRLVVDLHALLTAGTDPEAAARAWGEATQRAIGAGLGVMREAHRGAEHPGLLGRGKAERALSLLWRVTETAAGVGRNIASAPTVFVRALRNHGLRAIFPSPSYMARRYAIAATSPLLPLAYLWRPIRGAVKLLFRR